MLGRGKFPLQPRITKTKERKHANGRKKNKESVSENPNKSRRNGGSERVTALLSTAAMLLTCADFSAIDFSVYAEDNGGETPQLADFDLNGDGDYDDDGENKWGYELDSASDLYWFAEQVNGGDTSANAFLADDITVNEKLLSDLITVNDGTATVKDGKEVRVWKPIGNDAFSYSGTFNGNNYTISGLYFNDSSKIYVGLFGYVDKMKGTVKNVTVADSYFCGKDYVGGVCGWNYGTIANCYNTGDVTATGDDAEVGGVCGENVNRPIENCYNTGDVTATGNSAKVGGVCGYNEEGGAITNCYYLDVEGLDGIGVDNSGSADIRAMEEGQFASGEVCYLLNGGETQFETPVFYQNIGTDSLPVLDKTHNTVYFSSPCPRYLNTKDKAHSCTKFTDDEIITCSEDGFENYWYCNDCKKYFSNEACTDVITDIDAWKTGEGKVPARHKYDENNGFCTFCGGYEPATDSDEDGTYEISNAGQLYWVADKVNNDNENYGNANAELTKNITVNSGVLNENGELKTGDFTPWTPIGNSSNKYLGTFDGNNNTISGLYFNDSSKSYVGLFGNNQGTIKNVTVADSYFCGEDRVGGVCGYNEGTIANCYYLENTANGGIDGEDVTGQAEKKTEGQFKSGEVCWLLNDDEDMVGSHVFFQIIGIDESPVLDSTHSTVYAKSPCRAEYSNTGVENKNHSPASDKKDATCTEDGYLEYWYCKDCGKYFSDAGRQNVIENIEEWLTGEGRIPATGIHVYKNGYCEECGKPENSKEYFYSAGLTITDGTIINYWVNVDDDFDTTNAKIIFSIENGKKTEISFSEAKNLEDTNNYIFALPVAPNLMREKITAQVVRTDGSLGSSLEYSVEDYVESFKANYPQEEEKIALAEKMMTYGDYVYAFTHEGKNIGGEPIANYEENCEIDDEFNYVKTENAEGLKIQSASLLLGSRVSIHLQYKVTDGKDYTFSYNGKNELRVEKNGDIYDVYLDGILPQDFDEMFEFTSSDGDTFTYSVFTYIKNMIDSEDKSLTNLLNAMYEYNLSAASYKY